MSDTVITPSVANDAPAERTSLQASPEADAWTRDEHRPWFSDEVDPVNAALKFVASKKPAEKVEDPGELTASEPEAAPEVDSSIDQLGDSEAPVEKAPEEKAPEEAKPKAAAWAELHKQKKALFAKEQALKEKYAPLEKRVAEFEAAKNDKILALKLLGHEDPKAFLEEIAESGGKVSPAERIAREAQRELAELRAERAKEQEAKQRESAEREYQQGVDTHLKNIDNTLKTNPKFSKSLVAGLEGAKQAALEEMRKHFAKTERELGEGEVMPYDRALETVETNFKKELDALAGNPAIKAYLASKLTLDKLPQKPAAAVSETKTADKNIAAPAHGEPVVDIDKRIAEATNWLNKKRASRQ